MASIINSSTTSGLEATGDTSDELKLQTGGTDAVTVSSGQVCSFANNFGTVANLPAYQCRAWVNFDGTGTVAIRASGNVSSITDNGVGLYTVNFTTAMPDANYSLTANTEQGTGNSVFSVQKLTGTAFSTGSAAIVCKLEGAGPTDQSVITVTIFR